MGPSSTSYPNQKGRDVPPNVVKRKFLQMLKNAWTDPEILCFEDACHSIGWRGSKVAYWTGKLSVFESLKRDIQAAIVSKINKGAIKGDYNATASIWRSKQLGEKDETTQNQNVVKSKKFVLELKDGSITE